jgi:hypothetical protein
LPSGAAAVCAIAEPLIAAAAITTMFRIDLRMMEILFLINLPVDVAADVCHAHKLAVMASARNT